MADTARVSLLGLYVRRGADWIGPGGGEEVEDKGTHGSGGAAGPGLPEIARPSDLAFRRRMSAC
jgi:hypothetical protein